MRLDKTLEGHKDKDTPIWLMRQAGRYLPEYRELRASEPDFIKFCLNGGKAAAATMQPIERYGFDAAIIFSDILMIPWALGAGVRFVDGEGPRLDPMESPGDAGKMDSSGLLRDLEPVFEALAEVRGRLDGERNLIGFCGAPWTVATYMIEGGGSRDFESSRRLLWADPGGMESLLGRLADESVAYLEAKAAAGADTLMVFDSWAGAVPSDFLEPAVIEPTRRIVDGLRKRGVTAPVIGFPRGIGEGVVDYAAGAGVQAVGLDQGIDPFWADANLPAGMAVQGNLDPAALMEGGRAMLASADRILEAFANRPHIFNLGHGIGQHTPPEHVATLVDHVRKG